MEPKNTARDIIDGKGSSKTQRRSSFSPFRALRALSVSSQLSDASDSSSAAAPPADKGRTLRKTRTAETFRQDLYRAPSKGSSQYALDQLSVSTRPTTPSVTGSQAASLAGDFAGVLKSGALQGDAALLKPKREYLVLTSALLVKFKSRPAAVDHFPQISRPVSAVDGPSPLDSVLSFRNFGPAAELQIPLEKVVTVFKDESIKPFFSIEVWWKDTVDGSTFTSVELDFRLPEERDDWIRQIRLAVKQRTRAATEDRTPSHVESDIVQILAAKNPGHKVERPDIFPVIPRRPYTRLSANSKEIKKGWREGSSFYLAFGKNVCLLAQFSKSPTGQRVNPSLVPFGLVTLSQVNATVGDERFDLIFRYVQGARPTWPHAVNHSPADYPSTRPRGCRWPAGTTAPSSRASSKPIRSSSPHGLSGPGVRHSSSTASRTRSISRWAKIWAASSGRSRPSSKGTTRPP